MNKKILWPLVVGVLSLVFIIIGGSLFGFLEESVNEKIKDNLVLANNSSALDRFLNPPANVTLKVYFFNVTNGNEVALHEKPKLEEIGPYVYREKVVKENVEFLKNGSILQYDQKKIYEFDRHHSIGDETDIIHSLNLPLTLLPGPCKINPLCEMLFGTLMSDLFSKKLMRKYQVKDLIFGTYDILQEGSALSHFVPSLAFVKNDSIQNNNYEIFTGKDDIADLNKLYAYNKHRELKFWNDEYCDQLNGTDGTQFPPHIDKDTKLYIFSSDLCRSLYFKYEEKLEIKGITGYHFVVPEEVFDSPKNEPGNMCFCSREAKNGTCPLGKGVLDLSSCKQGAPVFISAPHFLNADKIYRDAVEGLDPEKEKHQSTIDVQKDTGSVLRVNKRIQINVNVKPIEHYENLVNITVMFPILWMNEHVMISSKAAADFQTDVLTPITVTQIVPPLILSLGLIFLVVSVILGIFLLIKRENYEYVS